MSLELRHVEAHALHPYVEDLRSLERDVSYPIDDGKDRFVLSHGDAYHPFFSSMGEAHFVLALEQGRVVGCIAAVRKPVRAPDGVVDGVYLGDLKVAKAWRGRGVPARMLFFALKVWARAPRRLSWRFAFGAAMRGERGDVMNAAKGVTPMKLGAPFARLNVYFVEPAKLAALKVEGAPSTPTSAGLDLSPGVTVDVVSTLGSKDFVLESTKQPWPLVHLPRGPAGWGRSHADSLRHAGQRLMAQAAKGPACFALDSRLVNEHDFLRRQGLEPGAVATVYAFSTTTRTRRAAWVHLATSEI